MAKIKYAVVIDSGCGIKNGEIPNVYSVPMTVVRCTNDTKTQDVSLRDGLDIKPAELVDDMLKNETVYKSASPVMGACADILKQISGLYDEIYILSTPIGPSGTYNTWASVIEDYKNVYLFNTKAPAHNARWMIDDLSKMKDINHDIVLEYCKKYFNRTLIGLVVNDLKYAIRGGRVSHLKGAIASFLKLYVAVSLQSEGKELNSPSRFNIIGTTRKSEKVYSILADLLKKQIGYDGTNLEHLCIYTSPVSDPKFKVDQLAKSISDGFKFKEIEFDSFPSVYVVHSGPNYIGFSATVKEKKD
ncbi:MAG: hypothetical protein Ta2E_07560 [Mycoplasmoidaceae bacterium]|nr:MAG: hypothetical protein Ta2E_07560 [Mycoplasmoidaceae bacterium]